MFVQAGLGLGDGEGLLDSPAAAGDVDQFAQGGPEPVIAQEVGVLLTTCVGRDSVTLAVRATLAVLAGFVVLAVLAAAVLGCGGVVGVAADQQAASPPGRAVAGVQGDPGPGVVAQPFRAMALAAVFPGPAGNLGGQGVDPELVKMSV